VPEPDLLPLDEMKARLERVLAYSPADSIEAAWIEVRRSEVWTGGGRREGGGAAGQAGANVAGGGGGGGGGGAQGRPRSGGNAGAGGQPVPRGGAAGRAEAPGGRPAAGAAAPEQPGKETTLWLRVRQSGRTGLHRTGSAEPSELENAVRDALAQARLAPPSPAEALAGRDGSGGTAANASGGALNEPAAMLFDPELAALQPSRARDLLERAAGAGEQLHLSWLEGRVVVATSAGARRAAQVTAARLTVRCGGGAGAGSATAAARRWQALDPGAVLERARSRHAAAPGAAAAGAPAASATAPGPPAGAAVVLSEQGAAALVDLLNRHALSAAAMRGGTSWLEGRLDQPIAAACLSLCDDGMDPLGLPFPFDLAGWPKRRVDLIGGGILLTPAVDAGLAQRIGRPPTPHAVAPDESIACNLRLLPAGEESAAGAAGEGEDELARLVEAAEDGLWIGALAGVECFDPRRLRFRARALGVRRIAGGRLGEAVPDLIWEAELPAVLGGVRVVGRRPVTVAGREMLLGAIAAPLVVVAGCGSWR
jgi:predicted Zn-dependent protease